MKVRQMIGNSGNAVANQFVLTDKGREIFQSYDSIIVIRNANGKITLDLNDWNYSVTTSRYRNLFLGETTAETKKKIKSGEYKLADLN